MTKVLIWYYMIIPLEYILVFIQLVLGTEMPGFKDTSPTLGYASKNMSFSKETGVIRFTFLAFAVAFEKLNSGWSKSEVMLNIQLWIQITGNILSDSLFGYGHAP